MRHRHEENEKLMIVMRGLPGSGKSTLARSFVGPDGVVYSTDDFFMVDGVYKHDVAKLGEYHAANQKRTEEAARAGITPIVVDNTITQKWEAKPYVEIAKKYGYRVTFVEPETSWAKDADELERRNTHGVPRQIIDKMLERYEPHETFTIDEVLSAKAPWEK